MSDAPQSTAHRARPPAVHLGDFTADRRVLMLMAMALVCTLAAAVLFQPALMGPPRKKERDGGGTGRRDEPARQPATGE